MGVFQFCCAVQAISAPKGRGSPSPGRICRDTTLKCVRNALTAKHVVAGWLLVVLFASRAPSAEPQLGGVTPLGAQRGTEIDAVFTGARLGDAQELMLDEPGIRAVKVEPQKDGSVKVRLSIAGDCRPGQHAVRLRTAGGISNLKLFSVGTLPEIREVEPNNDFDKPQKIPLNVTVNGVADYEDVDYFAVELKKGQRITAEIEGMRLGETFFDPYVAILDSRRFVLSAADDTPLVREDSVASAIAPADGLYVIEVRESSFRGSGACRYRLHVGTFPRPLAVYPAGGRPGQALDVRWLGDVAGSWTEKIVLPAAHPPVFGLLAHDAGGIAPSWNPFRLADLNDVMEKEPNDTPSQATVAEVPAAFNGVIEKPGDVDCFKFKAKAGHVFDVRVFARTLRSPLDSVLSVSRANGALIAANDDTDTPDSYLRFTAPADDQYVVSIWDQLKQGGPEFVYRIEVTPVEPRLTLGLPERNQFVEVTAPVPAGNRLAMMVSAQREDFGGDVNLELKNLSPGLRAELVAMPADQSQVPMLLSAALGAKPAGSWVDLVGRHTEPARTIEGRLRQRTLLVRGDNNREVVNYVADRMATAVTEPVPFHLEIVQPKVPLVQSGSMDLKVRLQRDPGFKAPVNLRMLYNPPGVSTPIVLTIPEGQNEANFPITADGGAGVRRWKIAILGEANAGNGTVVVSSQLADLEVAKPFFRFAFRAASVEQAQPADLAIKIEKQRDFAGEAKVELLGLPNEVTAQPKTITKDSTDLIFNLKTTKNSPPGQHRSLLCRAVVMADGQPITHMLGSGELRILPPVAPKPAPAGGPKPALKPEPPKPSQTPPRPLSRLEQLRQQK